MVQEFGPTNQTSVDSPPARSGKSKGVSMPSLCFTLDAKKKKKWHTKNSNSFVLLVLPLNNKIFVARFLDPIMSWTHLVFSRDALNSCSRMSLEPPYGGNSCLVCICAGSTFCFLVSALRPFYFLRCPSCADQGLK